MRFFWLCAAAGASLSLGLVLPSVPMTTTPRRAGPATAAANPTRLYAKGRLFDELAEISGENEETSAVEKPPLEPETVFFEGPPSWTELVVPAISVLTVIGIVPFAASVARQVWVRYKITSRRISVQSGFGGNDFSEIIYSDIVNCKYVFRSGGEVGDLVIELKDGSKLEMRHVPEFRKIYKYIISKISPEAQEASFTMKDA